MAEAAVEAAGQALLDAPLQAANNVPQLLAKLADPAAHDQGALLTAVEALKLFFTGAAARSQLPAAKLRKVGAGPAGNGEDAAAQHAAWLARQLAAFEQRLLGLLAAPSAVLQVSALSAAMALVKGAHSAKGAFDVELFRRCLSAALGPAASGELVGVLTAKYMAFADVRYHALTAVQSLAAQLQQLSQIGGGGSGSSICNAAEAARPLFEVMINVAQTPLAESFRDGVSSWSGAAEAGMARAAASGQRRKRKAEGGSSAGGGGESVRWLSWEHQRRAFANAWLAVLRCELPADAYRRVLVKMHDAIIPAMPNPLLLADFLSASVDQGGMTGMLALNGLFILVTRHGLEYPAFFRRLYGLLTLDAFQARHRVRSLQLADVFLASSMVPAYTAAAFAKRFARIALRAPPAGAVICLAFIHNLLRRHPATTQLLHRPPPRQQDAVDADDAMDAADAAEPPAAPATADAATGAGPPPDSTAAPTAAPPGGSAVRIAGQPTSGGGAAAAAAAGPRDSGARDSGAHPGPPHANGLSNGTGGGGGSSDSDSESDADAAAATQPAETAAAAQSRQAAAAAASAAPAAAAAAHPGADVYDEAEPDPARCRALESSLWEVAALRAHYDPQVAAFTAVLDKDLGDRRRTAEIDVAPLLGDSYAARIQAELKRRLKVAPTAFYAEPPASLFAANAAAGFLPGWDFTAV